MAVQSFRDWSLRSKTIIPAIIIAIILAVVVYIMVSQTQKDLVLDQARKTASSIANQIRADRQVYTEFVVGKLEKDGISVVPSNSTDFSGIKGGILLPASFVHATSQVVNSQGLHTADLRSLWNINPAKGPRNPKEREALEAVARDPAQLVEWITDEGKPTARYSQVTADVASARNCVTCHNTHPASPKKDFQLEDVMGGLVISLPLHDEFAKAERATLIWVGALFGIFLVLLLVVLYIQWHYITKPLIELENAAEKISLGEMDTEIPAEGKDKVGRLAAAFDRMRRSMKKAMEKLSKRG